MTGDPRSLARSRWLAYPSRPGQDDLPYVQMYRQSKQGSDTVITEEPDHSLDRAQRRLLRRIYNARTIPITVDDRHFLNYKEASRYLLSLPGNERTRAYEQMRSGAVMGSGSSHDCGPPANPE